MPAPILSSQRPVASSDGAAAPAPDAPGFFDWDTDSAKASAKLAVDDIPGSSHLVDLAVYMPFIDALAERRGGWSYSYYDGGWSIGDTKVNTAQFWKDVAEEQAKDPKFLPMLTSQYEFEAGVKSGRKEVHGANEAIAAKGGTISRLAGGVAGSMIDPINIMTIGYGGGGRAIVSQILRGGLANAAIETVEQPFVARERARQGRDWSLSEGAENVGMAFAGGAILEGAMRGIGAGYDLGRSGVEQAIAGNWERLPAPVRQAWEARASVNGSSIDELVLANATEAVVGRDRLTPDELAAVQVGRREAEVDLASPFVPNGAGAQLHQELLGETMTRIMAENPPKPLTTFTPQAEGGLANAPRGSTAIGSGTVAGDAQSRFMRKVRSAESSGSDSAGNPGSSAYGRYQFTSGTWLAYYKRRFGSGGKSDADILAKRSDGHLQDVLMADLTEDNAGFLRGRGEAVSEGNLYLVHFAGKGGAGKVLDADAAMPLSRLFNAETIAANPFLRGKTAGWLVDWAARKMGEAPSVRAGGRAEIDGAAIGDDLLIAQLQGETDRMTAAVAEARKRALGGAEPARVSEDDGPGMGEAERGADLPGDMAATRSWPEARRALESGSVGEVRGALFHPDTGPIDVKWGDDTAGLAHIAAQHPEVMDELPQLIAGMDVVSQTANRVQLESADHAAAVRLDWDGQRQTWLLTAFEREEAKARRGEKAPSAAEDRRAAEDAGDSPSARAISDVALAEQGLKVGDGTGHPAAFWDNAASRGEKPKKIFAVIDREGTIHTWETTKARAERALGRRAIDGGAVREIKPPKEIVAKAPRGPATGEELAAMPDSERTAFLDPGAEPTKAQADSLLHDARALAEQLDDTELRAAIDELDADDAALQAIRGCL